MCVDGFLNTHVVRKYLGHSTQSGNNDLSDCKMMRVTKPILIVCEYAATTDNYANIKCTCLLVNKGPNQPKSSAQTFFVTALEGND